MKQLTVIFCVLFLALFTGCKEVEEEPGIGVRDVCFSQGSGSLLGNGSSIFGRADCGQADDTYQLGNDNGDAHELTWDGLSGPLTGIIKIKQGATLIIVGNDGGTINSSIILDGGKISVQNNVTFAGKIQITPQTTTSAIAISSGKILTITTPEISIGDATLTINGQGEIANENDFVLDDKNSKMVFNDSGVTVSKVKMSGDSGGSVEVNENATVKTLTMGGTSNITIANNKNLIIEKLITISDESSTFIALNINLGSGTYGIITLSQLCLGKSIDINGTTPKTTTNAVLSVTANATLCFPGEISFNQTRVDQNVTLRVGDTENTSTLILKDETFNLEGKIVVTSNDTILTRSNSPNISNEGAAIHSMDVTAPSNQNTVLSADLSTTGGGSVSIVSSGDASNTVWFAPAGTTVFSESSTMTKVGGTATSIIAPTEVGTYYLFVVDKAGNPSDESNASLTVTASTPDPVSGTKAITAYSFTATANTALSVDVTGTINETNHTIALTVPTDTDVTALKANFSTTGSSVSVGVTSQASGTTTNDFSSVVTYTVTAADLTTQDYVVTVTVTPSSAKAITDYSFTATANTALSVDVTGTINETNHTIALTVPTDTDVTALKANFSTTGSSVSVGATSQASGTTTNDFSSVVTYTVTAADFTTQDYVVTVTVTPSSAKAITDYSLTTTGNPALSADVTGTINETNHTIALTVPTDTDVTALIANFSTTGSSVSVGGTSQANGSTANDFSSLVTYTVTAADLTTQDYVVTVTVTPSSTKAITAFSFTGTANTALSADVTGTINETNHTIALTVPTDTDVTALIANFSTTGSSVSVGGTSQANGSTANDFSSPVTYTVTAVDLTTQDYVVTVTITLSSAKAITDYSFTATGNPALSADVTGTINETNHTIALTVPTDTDVTALIANFSTTGSSVSVDGTNQASGSTANNFSSPVTYTITAVDFTTQDYVVTVTVTPSSAKAITDYSFTTTGNPALSADVTGTINETNHTIALTVPTDTDVTALKANFSTTGSSVSVDGTNQASGSTANNFSSPVTYTITAVDFTTQDYVVTVTVTPSSAKAITDYSFTTTGNPALSADVTGTINETNHTIALTVPTDTDVTALKANFSTTGSSVSVAATSQASGSTVNDFLSPVTYTVTAADLTTQDYVVTVTITPSSAKAITAFSFTTDNNPVLSADATGTINETNHTIVVTIPSDTTVGSLVATFTTTGSSVSVNGTNQTSGSTANDFSSGAIYTVTAADGSTQNYSVTVYSSLYAYYPFNGNANDESGRGNHGTVDSSVDGPSLTTDKNGTANSAYSFSGNAKGISVPDSPDLNVGIGNFTICVWVLTNQKVGSWKRLVTKRYGVNWYSLAVDGGRGIFEMSRGVTILTSSINNNNWHHLVVVRNGTTIYFYLDGAKNATKTFDPIRNLDGSAGTALEFGTLGDEIYDDESFKGTIDNIRIYKRALSSSEITNIYNSES